MSALSRPIRGPSTRKVLPEPGNAASTGSELYSYSCCQLACACGVTRMLPAVHVWETLSPRFVRSESWLWETIRSGASEPRSV